MGFQLLGHSQWTICSFLQHLHPHFYIFSTFIMGTILLTPEGQYWEKGNFSTLKLDVTVGFQCLEHLNWTICSSQSHFLLPNFYIFSTFIPGDQFLLSQRAKMWVSSDLGMLVEVSDYCQSPDRSQSYLRHMSHETYCSPLTQNLGPMFFVVFSGN